MATKVVTKGELWELLAKVPTARGSDLMHFLSDLVGPEEEHQYTIKKAFADGLMRHEVIRPGIKLQPTAPKIGIALPMGAKDDFTVYMNPKTKRRFVPKEVIDPNTDERVPAHPGARANGLVPVEWVMNALRIQNPLLVQMFFMVRKGVLSAQAREEMTREFLKMGVKYIFYWDDDVIIPPMCLYDMHNIMERNPNIAVLTGVYVTRHECPEPLIYKDAGMGAHWTFPIQPGVTEPIFAAGAGCMMARVEAIEDFARIHEEPFWMDFLDTEAMALRNEHSRWGHDIRFCRKFWSTWQIDDPEVRAPGPFGAAKEFKRPRNEEGKEIDWFTGYEVTPSKLQIVPGRDDVYWDPAAQMLVTREGLVPVDEDFEPAKRELTKHDPPRRAWEVHVAGWLQCIHYDYHLQRGFRMPEDAPCFLDQNTKTYWDHVWKSEGHDTWRQYHELHDRILGIIPKDSCVLDVGCGVGVLMERLLKRNHCKVYGIDISEEAIRLLRERELQGEVVDVAELEISDLKIPMDWEGRILWMVSTETIEHLSDEKLDRLLTQASDWCGAAVFSTPEGDLAGTPKGEHVQVWTLESLSERLRKYYETVSVERLEVANRPKNPYLIAVCSGPRPRRSEDERPEGDHLVRLEHVNSLG